MKTTRVQTSLYSLSRTFVILLTLALTTSCNVSGSLTPMSGRKANQGQGTDQPSVEPTPASSPLPKPPAPTPTPTPEDEYKSEVAPLWEQKSAAYKSWTIHAFDVVEKNGAALLLGTSDVKTFCPNYFSLSRNQKVSFWVYLVSAMVKYESNFIPTTRYKETTMGTDPVTGEHIYSEGLLQLSYQDQLWYPFCDEFDWKTDKHLSRTDPRKTIFDPHKNLKCGIQILNRIVDRKDLIAVDKGAYWAVLKPSSKYNKLSQIRALTKSVTFCTD